ncbi:rhomboid family intramembrane serine protease [Shewanella amazonensis]|uniref:Uncharacterized membrane protein n=1 Tax=Shewanella amazonensis (strain ATCC BAA-1098 / SB2B) TaxID=326297 RepID=A1S3I8_SHEAM|nr:rhomboid family intramembrane serine protease [Shewanella amazonensis]ABL98944.1 Uncharacterized membrane protein [Shewanella amazonensis SB2B]
MKKQLTCPGCQHQSFRVFDFHGEQVDTCDKCAGLWFENGELDRALSSADNGDDAVVLEQSMGAHLGCSERRCHDCGSSLERYHLMQEFEIEIDVCPSCRGVWLDKHECDKVVQSPRVRQALAELDGKISVKTWLFQFLSQMPVEFNLKPKTKPVVTWWLLGLNLVIFGIYGFDLSMIDPIFEQFALVPNQVMHGSHVWTLFSHMFLHGDIIHLAGNMYFLYVVGDNLEDALGRARFLGLYLVCGLAAAAAQIISEPGSDIYMVGASGAIAGLFGMYLLWFRYASLTFMFIVFQKKVSPLVFFGIWLALNIFGLYMAGEGVAYWAHIGGFVAGLIIGKLMYTSVMAANPMLALMNSPEVRVSR